ncbi:MAG: hypothetical protein RL190_1802, partial [Actinomycetota bacterium]
MKRITLAPMRTLWITPEALSPESCWRTSSSAIRIAIGSPAPTVPLT